MFASRRRGRAAIAALATLIAVALWFVGEMPPQPPSVRVFTYVHRGPGHADAPNHELHAGDLFMLNVTVPDCPDCRITVYALDPDGDLVATPLVGVRPDSRQLPSAVPVDDRPGVEDVFVLVTRTAPPAFDPLAQRVGAAPVDRSARRTALAAAVDDALDEGTYTLHHAGTWHHQP